MEINHFYTCGIDKAYTKVNEFLEELAQDYSQIIANPTKKWDDNREEMQFGFDVSGMNITGNVSLYNEGLILRGDLPFPASMFKGRIESIIKENLEKIFK